LWAVIVVLGRQVIVHGWVIGGRDFVCGSGATGSYHLHHVASTVAVEHLDQLPEMK
jgi:hypothetical protein